MRFGKLASSLRRWSRAVHREVSFFFAGLVVAYAVSGIAMNHRDTINPHYSVKRTEYSLPHSWPAGAKPDKDEVMRLLEPLGEEGNYTKHYFPKPGQMKVFLKSGSNLWVNMTEGTAVYEKLTRKPLLGAFATLHYNPGRWWTWFADFFSVCLILITLTGLLMVRGKTLWGRAGILLLVGILIPILFLFIE